MRGQKICQWSQSAIMYVIHHMFLPPKLPGEDDSTLDHETALLDITLKSLCDFKKWVAEDHIGTIDSVIDMVSSMAWVRDGQGTVDEEKLSRALRDLTHKGGTIVLHIRAQNAGVMISKVNQCIHVEVFELSPLNEPVLATKGRLRRIFPGFGLALPTNTFERSELQATMAHTLAKMSHQPIVDTKPKVKKAGRMHDEARDTTHPKAVTELFMGFLRPLSTTVDAEMTRLWKNTREEVNWRNALLPWRRTPIWMLVRVAMQILFSRLAGFQKSPVNYYKNFMVFLMADVLQLALQNRVDCELLYAMNAKLTRRLLKLQRSDPRAGLAAVQEIMCTTAGHIRANWKSIMQKASPRHDLSILEDLNFEQDTFSLVERLTTFIDSLSLGAKEAASNFFQPTSTLTKYQARTLPTCPCASEEYLVYNLHALEAWVASELPQWLERHKSEAETCGRLGALIADYYRQALPVYSGNPESFSVLLLTIIELWIACDQSAMYICNFLEDYDPGVPTEVVQCLILPFQSQMRRLLRAEGYLKDRRRLARNQSPSIFRDYGRESCFAVKYFDQSPQHQHLRRDIETYANQLRNAKVTELHQKHERYNFLRQRYEHSNCDYHEVIVDHENHFLELRHNPNCGRCHDKSQMDSITIGVHEWPLPSKDLEAKSVVFELLNPPFFSQWRDTALFLLTKVLKAESPSCHKPRASHTLKTYSGLSSFFVPSSPQQRLGLLSENKPHGVTHRRDKCVSLI